MGFFDGPERKYYTMPYCKTSETVGYDKCRVFNKDTGVELTDWGIVECNAKEGWLIRYMKNGDGTYVIDGDHIATERVKGYFEIRLYK